MGLGNLLSSMKQQDMDSAVLREPFKREKHDACIAHWRRRCEEELQKVMTRKASENSEALTQSVGLSKSFESLQSAWARLYSTGMETPLSTGTFYPALLLSVSDFVQWFSDIEKYGGPGEAAGGLQYDVALRAYCLHQGNKEISELLLSCVRKGDTAGTMLPLLSLDRLFDLESCNFCHFPDVAAELLARQESALDEEEDPSGDALMQNDERLKSIWRKFLSRPHQGWSVNLDAFIGVVQEMKEVLEGEDDAVGDITNELGVETVPGDFQQQAEKFFKEVEIDDSVLENIDCHERVKNLLDVCWRREATVSRERRAMVGGKTSKKKKNLSEPKGDEAVYGAYFGGFEQTVAVARRVLQIAEASFNEKKKGEEGEDNHHAEAAVRKVHRMAFFKLIDLVSENQVLSPATSNISSANISGDQSDSFLDQTATLLRRGLWMQLMQSLSVIVAKGNNDDLLVELGWGLVAAEEALPSHDDTAKKESASRVVSLLGLFASNVISSIDSNSIPASSELLNSERLAKLTQLVQSSSSILLLVGGPLQNVALVKQVDQLIEHVSVAAKSHSSDASLSALITFQFLLQVSELRNGLQSDSSSGSSGAELLSKDMFEKLLLLVPFAKQIAEVEAMRSQLLLQAVDASQRTQIGKKCNAAVKNITWESQKRSAAGMFSVGEKRGAIEEATEMPPKARQRSEGPKLGKRTNDELSVCIPGIMKANAKNRICKFFEKSDEGGKNSAHGIEIIDLQPLKKDKERVLAFVQFRDQISFDYAVSLDGTSMTMGGEEDREEGTEVVKKVSVKKYEKPAEKQKSFDPHPVSRSSDVGNLQLQSKPNRGGGLGGLAAALSSGEENGQKGKDFFNNLFK